MKANKGEWSEVYVLFKLLSEQKLYAGDSNFQKLAKDFYPIIEVIKSDGDQPVSFCIDSRKKTVKISRFDRVVHEISIDQFSKQATYLLNAILSSNKTFSPPTTEIFLSEMGCDQLKSPSRTKKDVEVILNEQRRIGFFSPRLLSFSIKSWLGSPPTLLNSSQATNFVFKVISEDITEQIITIVNFEKTFYQKFQKLNQAIYLLSFNHLENQTFEDNLRLSDGDIPAILSCLLLEYYSSQGISKIKDLVENLKIKNPLGFNNVYFYERKIKKFLADISLGMVPNTNWNGYHSVNGGHIIVLKNGEIVTYFYIYDQIGFEEYLFLNTKLETPSTSRHKFGKLYQDHEQNLAIKLNLQIRFI